jgi:hypothetical protein
MLLNIQASVPGMAQNAKTRKKAMAQKAIMMKK